MIAFLGLGAMGSRMARRLLDAVHDVTVWNRTPERAEPLRAAGARVAATPAEAAAGARTVHTMLTGPQALAEVVAALDLAPGTTLVEHSTVGPAAIAELAAGLPDGVGLVDAPVLGSIAEAEAGTLKVFAGGDVAAVQELTPLLATLGAVLHVGPAGSGAAAKLVANSTLFGVLSALAESVALADELGLPRDTAFDVLATTPLAAQAERRRPVIETGEAQVRFALALARKDADLVLEAAGDRDLRVLAAARSWLADAEAAGRGSEDYASLLTHVLRSA